MPIEVEITTALTKEKVGAKATGQETYDHTQWETWEPWFNRHLTWNQIWNKLMTAWNVSNPPAIASVTYNAGEQGNGVQNINGGYIWPYEGQPYAKIPGVRSAQVITTPTKQPNITLKRNAALLDHHVFFNKLKDGSKVHESATVSLEVKQGVSSEWSKERSIGGSVSVGVKVGVEGAGDIETSTTFNWETKIGESHTQSRELGAGETSQLEVELEPGDYALGMFGAYLGTITAVCDITATLQGGVVFNIAPHYWINFTTIGTPNHPPVVKPVTRCWVSWDHLNQVITDGPETYPTANATLLIDVGWYADSRIGVYPLADGSEDSINQALHQALGTPRVADAHPPKNMPATLNEQGKGKAVTRGSGCGYPKPGQPRGSIPHPVTTLPPHPPTPSHTPSLYSQP